MAIETWCERLNPTDAMFLDIEDAGAHMHVGGVFVYQGRPPPYRDFVAYIESRLDLVPRYRQRLAQVPLGLGRPVWVDDARFDITHHAKHSAVVPPGGDEELKRAAARIFSQPLDHTRPLWELELVEGLADDRFAVVSKTHHSVLDGIAGNNVIAAITDGEPIFQVTAPTSTWTPRAAPGPLALAADAVREGVTAPARLLRDALRSPGGARNVLAEGIAGAAAIARLGWRGRAPDVGLNGAVGRDRRFEMVTVDLSSVKRVRTALGATVNDVVLALVAAGARALLRHRGARLRDDLRVFVPVNARPPGAADTLGNQVAVLYCPLPVAEADPVERVRRIAAAMKECKERHDTAASLAVARLGELAPPPLAAAAARLEIAYRRFHFVVSNVPGAQRPRYYLGRRLLAFHPLIPLSRQQQLSVGLHTYCDTIGFGIAADADAVPDLAIFAKALAAELNTLLHATRNVPAIAAARAPLEAPAPEAAPPTFVQPTEPPRPERRP